MQSNKFLAARRIIWRVNLGLLISLDIESFDTISMSWPRYVKAGIRGKGKYGIYMFWKYGK